MADAIVSVVLEELGSVVGLQIKQKVKLVVDVDDEVNQLTSNFQAIQAVVLDAEQREVTETAVRVWLEKLKHVSYDIEDVLDEWRAAILQRLQIKSKVCSNFLLPCSVLRSVDLRHDIASKIKENNERLDAIAKEKDRYGFNTLSIEQPLPTTFSFVDVSTVVGREKENNALVYKLLDESYEEGNGLHIISIVGMGGIGKTTLAQLAYYNDKVIKNFEKRIWVCVSDPFDKLRTAKAILETLEGDASDLSTLQSLLEKISESLRRKKFLIVLDDVWTEDYGDWAPFHHCLQNGHHGSKVLVTTRKETTALMMESIETISIKELSNEHCWSLLTQIAFFGRSYEECEKLVGIGRKIVTKCKGLPLAAKTMGSLLRFKRNREDWENILNSKMWKLKEYENGVFPPLLLSYYDLPPMVKRCFTYCAMFPKDFIFEKDDLIKLWMAQGYLELEDNKELEIIGEEYFNSLAMHSFFQEFEEDDDGSIIICKMHDIVHDLAQFLSKNECCMIEVEDLSKGYINALCEKVHQLWLTVSEIDTFPIFICKFKKLRSLLIQFDGYRVNNLIDEVPPKLFDELLCLRALTISGGVLHIKHIPKEIGQLVNLRYLDLSNNDKLGKLPDTLCELYNLQTLKLDWCEKLKELPRGIGKLINLRCLLNRGTHSLMYMPKGIERLHLRTLSEFHWSGGYSGKASSLNYLNKYQRLAQLHIKVLGDATKVINQIAGLKIFKNIHDLNLVFGMTADSMNDEMILSALQPPPNLEVLTISNYPIDMVSTLRMTSLTNLRSIKLSGCIKCLHLPPLGKLPSLEKLVIERMDSVGEVGNGFLGVESGEASSSIIYLPKLKTLRFEEMLEWEVWDFGNEDDTCTIMPSLRSLQITRCYKLKGLPKQLLHRMAPLQNLKILGCPILEKVYEKGKGDKWQDISHIPNIQIGRGPQG